MHPWAALSGQLWPVFASATASSSPTPSGTPTGSPSPTPLSTVGTAVGMTPVGENPMLVIFRFVVGIAVVFFLLWLVARWVRRSGLGDYEGPGLRILARAPLTRSSQVAVVEIGGRMFLVGAGDSGVNPIAELYDTDELAVELQTDSAAEGTQTARGPLGERAGAFVKKLRGAKNITGGAQVNPAGGVTLKPVTKTANKTATKTTSKSAGNAALRRYAENSYVDNALPTDKTSEAQMDRLARQLAAEFGAPLNDARPGER